jgi:hypothetical protein
MSFSSEEYNPISKSREVGYSLAGEIGERAFIELELAYATRLLPRFSDDKIIRRNQNILLYWQRGYYKSTILRVFSQTIPQDMGTVDISSMTQEKIFGSIDEKKKHIIQPAFTNDVKFVFVSELSSLLGQHDSMRQFVNLSNAVLENERISRQTLKLGHGEINETELLELQEKGVSYDAVKGELSYTPNVCFFAATRPLDNRYFTYLKESGHFSRYHVIQRDISESDVQKHFRKDYTLDQKAFDQLKQINLALSRVEVKKVLKPSESLMQPVYDNIIELVKDEIADRRDLAIAEIITPRTKGDIIRELVAYAFLRATAQNDSTVIEELQYTKDDLDFVLENPYHFVEFALNPIIAPEMSKPQRSRKRERIKEAILECLNNGTEKHIDDVRSFVEKRLAPLLVSQATFYNGLKELKDAGRIDRPRPDFYTLTKGEGR